MSLKVIEKSLVCSIGGRRSYNRTETPPAFSRLNPFPGKVSQKNSPIISSIQPGGMLDRAEKFIITRHWIPVAAFRCSALRVKRIELYVQQQLLHRGFVPDFHPLPADWSFKLEVKCCTKLRLTVHQLDHQP